MKPVTPWAVPVDHLVRLNGSRGATPFFYTGKSTQYLRVRRVFYSFNTLETCKYLQNYCCLQVFFVEQYNDYWEIFIVFFLAQHLWSPHCSLNTRQFVVICQTTPDDSTQSPASDDASRTGRYSAAVANSSYARVTREFGQHCPSNLLRFSSMNC